MNFLYNTLALCLCITSLAFAQKNDTKTYLDKDDVGAWGMKDADSEWLINPFYDTLFYLDRTKFDPETYEVTRYQTDYVLGQSLMSDRWRLFQKDGSMRYEADAILPRLMGDIILVKIKNKWGLVATNGKVVLPVKCTQIDWYEDVLALKDRKEQWHLFDPQNGYLESRTFDKVALLSPPNKEVVLLVESKGQQGLLDKSFRTIVPIHYNYLALEEHKKGYVYYESSNDECGYIHLKTRKIKSTACKQ